MSRGRRVLLAVIALVAAAAAVLAFTTFGAASEGPIGSSLQAISSSLRSLEFSIRQRASAPGRRSKLRWFDQHRSELSWLRAPDRLLLGAYSNEGAETLLGVRQLEQAIGTTLPLVQIYTAWGDRPEHQFPERMATTIWNMGSIPVVTWEPWLTVFDNARHPHLPLREKRDLHGLAMVTRGDYDFYIDPWAASAARFGRPIFLRFAHEMNDPYRYPWGPQNNTKEEFITAWRHVVQRFRDAGAHNVIWVWSPHVAHEYWDLYYPGDGTVDWVATGVLNFGPIAYWSRWWSFDEIFGQKYERLAAFGKPLMIAEFGSLSVGGDRRQWYENAISPLRDRYPRVRALLFFEVANDQTVTYQSIDWTVRHDPELARTIAIALEPAPAHQ